MRVSLGAAGPGGGAGPEDSDGDPEEPAEDAGKPGPFEPPTSRSLGGTEWVLEGIRPGLASLSGLTRPWAYFPHLENEND